jgi:glycogen synthase
MVHHALFHALEKGAQFVLLRRLIGSAMRADHSWNQPGRQYLDVYEHIRRGLRAAPDLEAAA